MEITFLTVGPNAMMLSVSRSNWAMIKLFMVTEGLSHVYVVDGSDHYNVSLRGGRMSKSKV